jgi:predicted glycoside hydrolase/deacetylase ChbG (UPF0249 family)
MKEPKRLIVNADGFGFGSGATQGIIDAIREGKFISSVSVNANFPAAERIRDLVSEFPHISIGVHLNPMVGKPCLPAEQVPSLIGCDGCLQNEKFPKLLRQGLISLTELEAEFDAQISKVKELAGSRLTHLDSQGNRHLEYLNLFLKVARKWGIHRMRNNQSLICLESSRPLQSRLKIYLRRPHVWVAHTYRKYQMHRARTAGMRMADRLVTVGYAGVGNKSNPENWLRILKNLSTGTYEIYCHPAYPDDTLHRWSYYRDERAKELAILRKEELRNAAVAADVQIVSFEAI